MSRCDGERMLAEIVADLERTFAVTGLVRRRHCIRVHGAWRRNGWRSARESRHSSRHRRRPGPPLWLLLELTYRCPLHCVYCSNPTEFARTGQELGTDDWLRVLREARALGAVQLGLSGGEPLLRDDLEPIVAGSACAGLLHESHHVRRRAQRIAHRAR